MAFSEQYDVIVIGGGHAGVEAAMAAARMDVKTLLVTHNIETIGQMSCNPAIGGIGKGHIVKEVDALGGLMARAIDQSGIHFRTLNSRKGPAVRATRAQADRTLYKQAVRCAVENQPNLTVFQQSVDDLIIENGTVRGVVTQLGLRFSAAAVVLTTGTFLNGKVHVGLTNHGGGRAGDPPATALAQKLRELSLAVDRLKTGTPPRIDGKTIDYSGLAAQPGDEPCPVFSYMGNVSEHPQQVHCHITHTNADTHEIIRGALDQSPIYGGGTIEGVGPRYCPSIEDKVVRFADRDSHQIFIEPEGLHTTEVYPNGISTSLPFDVQVRYVRSIKGFANAQITRPGYAIEYDFFDPRGLQSSLQTKAIAGLYFAGQINGTTGYEEAAGQGLIAGLNAALQVKDKAPWSPARSEAYIGVMIDDLITQGTAEPYRMFTSRAEYRLQLREDNADVRLTPIGHELGLVDAARWQAFNDKREAIASEQQRLSKTWLRPETVDQAVAQRVLGQPLSKESNCLDLLRRPDVQYTALMELAELSAVSHADAVNQLTIETRYSGYIERQKDEIKKREKHENTAFPADFDFAGVQGLSAEVVQKLSNVQPQTVGQAARIAGVTPAAISLLLVHLKKHAHRAA